MHLRLSGQLKHPAWMGLDWIWTAPDLARWPPTGRESRFFRQTVSLPVAPVRAWIQVWSEMGYELWINGFSAYQAPQGLSWTHRDEVEHLLEPGDNTIAIEHYAGRWRYGGLLVVGEAELPDGAVIPIRSDTTWLGREDRAAGWNEPGTPTDGWRPARRMLDGWKEAGSPPPGPASPRVNYGSFDPTVFGQQLAAHYGVDDPDRLQIPTERYVAFQGGGYWAPLERLPDGSIAAIVRAGGCHSGRDGRLLMIRSRDGGRTWSAPVLVADSPWCDYGCALGVLPGGTLVVGYRKTRDYDGRGNFLDGDEKARRRYAQTLVTRSLDGGETWGPPQLLNPPGRPSDLPYDKMINLPDGSMWMHTYIDRAGYRVSRDQGRIWGPLTLITAQECNETALARLDDGRIVAAMRGAAAGGEACWVATTDDGGASWSKPAQVTERSECPPDLIQLRDGRLVMTFGRRAFPNGIQVVLSDDRGDSWY